MYKQITELKTQTKLNNEGREKMFKTNLADFDAWDPKVRLFSLIQVKPGEEVEYHMHVGESETFFILSGKGIYNDNGTNVDVVPGMVTFTPSGQGHAIKNTGDEMLTFIALIVLEQAFTGAACELYLRKALYNFKNTINNQKGELKCIL